MKGRKVKNVIKSTAISSARYHGPLITRGVRLHYIKFISWINFFISAVLYWGSTYIDKLGVFQFIFLISVIFSLLSAVVSLIPKLVYKFSSIFYLLISANIMILLINLDFIGLIMLVDNNGIYSLAALLFIFSMIGVFVTMLGVYSWYYLPQNQGKVWEFNQVKTGDQKQEWRSNFVYTFAAVTIIPAFLTGYIQNAFGIFLGILFTTTLPAVIVDAIYAAIYVRKHPESES